MKRLFMGAMVALGAFRTAGGWIFVVLVVVILATLVLSSFHPRVHRDSGFGLHPEPDQIDAGC